MLGKCDLDRAAVRKERGGRLEPNQRCAERRALHLLDVIGVVEANRDDLARRDRQIDLEIAQRQDPAVEFDPEPIRFRQDDGRNHRALRRRRIRSFDLKPPKVRMECESRR